MSKEPREENTGEVLVDLYTLFTKQGRKEEAEEIMRDADSLGYYEAVEAMKTI